MWGRICPRFQLMEVWFFFCFIYFYVGCINLSFAYVEGESLLMALKDVALSSGR